MKIEEQVLSIEQMNHLKDLGVKVEDTAMCWVKPNEHTHWNETTDGSSSIYHVLQRGLLVHRYLFSDIIPTLTLQEILEMLPEFIEVECKIPRLFKLLISKNNINYSNAFNYVINDEYGKSMIDNAYDMLCWVAEDGYLNASNSMQFKNK